MLFNCVKFNKFPNVRFCPKADVRNIFLFDSERLHTPSFIGLPTSIELFLSNKVKMKYVVYLFIAILVGAITGWLAKYSKSQKPIKISKTTKIDAPVSIINTFDGRGAVVFVNLRSSIFCHQFQIYVQNLNMFLNATTKV